MSVDGEARGRQGAKAGRATGHLEYAVARVADEMMMMRFIRCFVAYLSPGQLHGHSVTIAKHRPQMPVDRGDSDA